MKKAGLLLGLAMAVLSVYGQNRENEKVKVKYVQMPLKPLVGATTYNCSFDATELEKALPDAKFELGISEDYIKGVMKIQGLEYKNENADVTIRLVSDALEIVEQKYEDLSNGGSTPNWKIIFTVRANWKLITNGNPQLDLAVNEKGTINLNFPSDYDKYGVPAQAVPNKETLVKSMEVNGDKIKKSILEQAAIKTIEKAGRKAVSELSYKPIIKEFEICSFKTNKKYDASRWVAITPTAIANLKSLTTGTLPSEVFAKSKEAIDFWQEQYEANKADLKANDKIICAAVENLIIFLTLTNPSLIKDEYYTALNEVAYFDAETLTPWSKDMAERAKANTQSVDYAALTANAALKDQHYQVMIKTKTGETIPGVITFGSPYYLNPYELSEGFNLYKLADYNNEMSSVNSKIKIDNKTVASYSLFGKTFESVKYSDLTVVSLSGSECFMEKIVDGTAPLFKKYSLSAESSQGMVVGAGSTNYSATDLTNSRKNPNMLVQKAKKTSVVFNYSKLADMLKDCNTVVEKINTGAYGNPTVKSSDKSTTFGSLSATLAKGTVGDVNESIITQIMVEYNSLMK